MAAEELAGLERLDVKLKAMKAELKAAVQATGSRLMDLHGIGPAGAARILADVGDVTRFPNRNHFASRPAPRRSRPPAASTSATGCPGREPAAQPRPLHGRDRRLRHDTEGRACYRRKVAAGKTSMEAMRCLRRRLSDAVCRQLAADARSLQDTGPGGHSGATLQSSAADLPPGIGTSDQPLPGPAPRRYPRRPQP